MKQNKKSRICKKKVRKLTPNLYQRIMCRGKDLSFSDSLARLYSKKWTVSRSITFHFPAFSSHSFEALLRRFNLRKKKAKAKYWKSRKEVEESERKYWGRVRKRRMQKSITWMPKERTPCDMRTKPNSATGGLVSITLLPLYSSSALCYFK